MVSQVQCYVFCHLNYVTPYQLYLTRLLHAAMYLMIGSWVILQHFLKVAMRLNLLITGRYQLLLRVSCF